MEAVFGLVSGCGFGFWQPTWRQWQQAPFVMAADKLWLI